MDALVGTVLEGAYRITRLMGEGGMGAVYEAVQLRLNKRVAIKLMARDLASNREALARFHREAEITSHLGHPHLVTVFDFGQAESGEPYLVMEYLEGEDLDHRLRRVGRMPIEAVVHVVRQVASALNAAHDQGVVHRDLKPGNVFLVQIPGEPDFVKILDFGISKVKAARTQLTSASAVMGTPNYMAPEQATGMVEEIDHRTDQWALACIAWEMLLGRGPFVADETAALLYQIINLDPHPLAPRVPGLPPAVETALRRALRKKPAERFSSMREFSRDLEEAATGRPSDVTPAPMTVPAALAAGGTVLYGATPVPPAPAPAPAPVRQLSARAPRDARKIANSAHVHLRNWIAPIQGRARELVRDWTKPVPVVLMSMKEWARLAMGQVSRRPIYVVAAGAGVLLLIGALLLLRSSPAPKPTAAHTAAPVVTPLPQPAPPVAAPEPAEARPAQPAPTSGRPKRQKWVDPFTSGDSDKPAKTTAPPRHKTKRKMFQEL
jgi:serine/threonine-protein kinase